MDFFSSFRDRLKGWFTKPDGVVSRLVASIKSLTDAHPGRAPWIVACVVLLLIVTMVNPTKLISFLWIATKIIGAALIAVGLFRAWDVHPETLEGIERAMAYTRRVTLMAAAIVAAAFTP
jgi:hypothetical protein